MDAQPELGQSAPWRPTQIAYQDWNIAGQAGRVRRIAGGFEFRMSRFHPLYWLIGPRGIKTIHDSQIEVVQQASPIMLIRFDGNDEILLRDSVLDDCSTAEFAIEPLSDGLGSGRRLTDMASRQRKLGPATWQHGRTTGAADGNVGLTVRARKYLLVGVAAVGVTLLALLR